MTEPSRLLAGRRGLSRQEKEAVLEGVLAEVDRPIAPRWRRRLQIGVLALAGAAGAVMLVIPRPAPAPPSDLRGELTARGGALPAGFDVSCVPAPCATGSKLVFDITSTGNAGYIAAFARSADRWVWYFPSAPDARSRPLPPGGGVLDTGIVLGAEHPPGRYTVEAVFSPEPLDRAAVRAAAERGGTVRREVTIR